MDQQIAGVEGRAILLCDMDETLIAGKSMLSYFQLAAQMGGSPLQKSAASFLDTIGNGDANSRASLNRRYYEHMKGISSSYARELGARWFNQRTEDPDFFLQSVLERVRDYQKRGYELWIVSGSHHACVDHVARYLNADKVLCTEQAVTEDGLFTGDVAVPMIGADKAAAVSSHLAPLVPSQVEIAAMGDHLSDIPMLSLAQTAFVVEPDEQLSGIANAMGWNCIPHAQELIYK